MSRAELDEIAAEIVACRLCPRLVAWREQVAREKVARHRDDTYWGRPVPGFGDPRASVLLVGLAPGAHGANRTGRIFTGDSSGDFLFPALHRAGFASSPVSRRADDGMRLSGLFIAAAARCAPPGNAPLPQELRNCHPYLGREWAALPRLKAVLCLGRIAHDAAIGVLQQRGLPVRKSAVPFAHGAEHALPGAPLLVDSFHVSRQNTNTGRLTPAMFDAVLRRLREIAGLPPVRD
jgi:uracil-DNA glycosylase family 4